MNKFNFIDAAYCIANNSFPDDEQVQNILNVLACIIAFNKDNPEMYLANKHYKELYEDYRKIMQKRKDGHDWHSLKNEIIDV